MLFDGSGMMNVRGKALVKVRMERDVSRKVEKAERR